MMATVVVACVFVCVLSDRALTSIFVGKQVHENTQLGICNVFHELAQRSPVSEAQAGLCFVRGGQVSLFLRSTLLPYVWQIPRC